MDKATLQKPFPSLYPYATLYPFRKEHPYQITPNNLSSFSAVALMAGIATELPNCL